MGPALLRWNFYVNSYKNRFCLQLLKWIHKKQQDRQAVTVAATPVCTRDTEKNKQTSVFLLPGIEWTAKEIMALGLPVCMPFNWKMEYMNFSKLTKNSNW